MLARRSTKQTSMLNRINKRRAGFTLVEVLIVVTIIGLLAGVAVPGFLRSRKRSQASRILNDLRLINCAVDQYAIENNKSSGVSVPISEWTKYLKVGTNLYLTGKDTLGNSFSAVNVHSLPGVPVSSKTALSDVVDDTFWSPYQ